MTHLKCRFFVIRLKPLKKDYLKQRAFALFFSQCFQSLFLCLSFLTVNKVILKDTVITFLFNVCSSQSLNICHRQCIVVVSIIVVLGSVARGHSLLLMRCIRKAKEPGK